MRRYLAFAYIVFSNFISSLDSLFCQNNTTYDFLVESRDNDKSIKVNGKYYSPILDGFSENLKSDLGLNFISVPTIDSRLFRLYLGIIKPLPSPLFLFLFLIKYITTFDRHLSLHHATFARYSISLLFTAVDLH